MEREVIWFKLAVCASGNKMLVPVMYLTHFKDEIQKKNTYFKKNNCEAFYLFVPRGKFALIVCDYCGCHFM